ncbi:MAG: amino acid adenylation domain-containing protein [Nostoc desertorum CM1-VF14]|jgi:amino acid adenylation domain-containing protein|nr:amino acid adenylation domain-containing protein [Nostoc desertorum CM1-VF14]
MNNIEDLYELSPMQQGMLFHSLYSPESEVYFEQVVLTLQGKLNLTAFQQAWQKVVNRHTVLRSSFYWEEIDKPLQMVSRQVDLSWTIYDWQHWDHYQQQSQLAAFLKRDRTENIALAQAPLMRFTVMQLGNDSYQFIWSHHHILFDGWSMPIILQEVFDLYEAYHQGKSLTLQPSYPYRDYIHWLLQQDHSKAEKFWQNQLQGFEAATPLGIDKLAGKKTPQVTYEEIPLQLSLEVTQKLQLLAKKHRLTLNNLVQGAWGLLLSRYSGESDIVFGATVSGRPSSLPDVDKRVGLFINTLPIRLKISEQAELIPWLQELQSQQIEQEQYAYYSLAEIQKNSDILPGSPLFESILIFENYPIDSSAATADKTLKIVNFRCLERTNYPLTLVVIPDAQLSGRLLYDRSRFVPEPVERMVEHFQNLLTAIAENPQQPLALIPILTLQEQQQLLRDWNDTQGSYAYDKCIHQLVEEQAERTPDAVAIVFENQSLTYSQLNTQANQLAHYLRSIGVTTETLIGLSVERSLDTILALLGILKAGAAYLPLDPDYPQERLHFMIEDSQISLLLTQSPLLKKLPKTQTHTLLLDELWPKIAAYSQENLTGIVQARNLASVIYTSGSTGKPKGVMVEHIGLYNLAQAQIKTFGVQANSRVLQFASFSFDACIWEILMALGSGATLCLAHKDAIAPGQPLLAVLREQEITHVTLPPSTLAALPFEPLPALKTLVVAGEACSPELVKQWSVGRNFFNAYGPTEASVCATIAQCKPDNEQITIGRPISNVQIYILDSHLQPVPIGVIGEIYIGGAGIARDYLNRPEAQEKFIPNPFEKVKTSRLYKTGDLGRYLLDGSIEYLGRIDHQVKVRGFRIELGEIEAALHQHESVHLACVMLREDELDKRLVAYVVLKSGTSEDSSHLETQQEQAVRDLRAYLKAKLPSYMIPSAFVVLEALPITPNGKINRRALPAPDFHSHKQNYIAPRNVIEEKLSQIWAEVLKLERVSIEDNFFELGGHSLLATQVISRCQQAFESTFPLRYLFENPTIAQLSVVILQQLQSGSLLKLPTISSVNRDTDILLSWAQERLWFVNKLGETNAAYTIDHTIRLQGKLNIQALEQAFQALIQRHEPLRTQFKVKNNQPIQAIAPHVNFQLSIVNLQNLSHPQQAVQHLLTKAVSEPFDLDNDSLFRVKLWQLAEDEYILLLAVHHIAADGWSMGILISELSAFYHSFSTGTTVNLEPLPIQYADFALWQRQWFTNEVLERQLNYWQQKLADIPLLHQLPGDRPRPAVQTFRGGTEVFQLDRELTEQLKQFSQQSGCTLFMTLLAGFAVLLSRYSGQNDIVIGSPIANRNRTEIEGLIGFFVNTLVLRFDLSENLSFKEFLAQVRTNTQDAYDHQDLPFEMLVEELQPERHLDRNPLVQIVFALQNAPRSPWDLPGMTVEQIDAGLDSVRLDLEIHLSEVPDGLEGYCYYNRDLFDGETITRLMTHFRILLTGIAKNPQQSVALIPLLTPQEQQQLLKDWNDTQSDYAYDKCIHQLVEQQAQLTPDAVAVVFENQSLTYAQLNRRANQLAHYLRSIGVETETLIGLSVERSLEMIIALLGILKAGAAYIPLDPEYPDERLRFMISDSQVSLLLTQATLLKKLPHTQTQTLLLDELWQKITSSSQENLTGVVGASNLANVIYTSGSTGKPKGVMVEHIGLYNLAQAQIKTFGVEASSRVLQFASFSFDACVSEILMALGSGATLCLARKDALMPGQPLIALLRNAAITHVTLPPSALAVLPVEPLPALKTLVVAGEACSAELIQRWSAGRNFFNAYGPTEGSVCATIAKCTPDDVNVTIGHAIANVQVYILDSHLQPVPIGVIGEIHIGGAGIARGYLHRNQLTQEKFIPHPFSDNSSDKLYKTGDLGRYLPDSSIEYLGRIDHQVKVRGFRIELEEIEAVLSKHPLVQEAVVVALTDYAAAQNDNKLNTNLAAYLVPAIQGQVLPEQLAQWQSEYVSDWQTLYENSYSQPLASDSDLTFNIKGWNSSYTGQAIPAPAMREWVENTVDRILLGQPQRVLEIGCGSGLLLFQVAKYCQEYWGTDYSLATIQNLERIYDTVEGLGTVKLLHRTADNFEGIPKGSFDTVVINSVIQYFPSVDYLLQVLEGAVNSLAITGTIFVGDVRSLPLLEPYHAAVRLARADAETTVEQWQSQVNQSVASEEELLVNPQFFITLKQRFPQIKEVVIEPKRGQADNELTQFRYDVTLYLTQNQEQLTTHPETVIPWLNWQKEGLSLAQLQEKLQQGQLSYLGIRDVPNQRLEVALQILDWLESPPNVSTVEELRQVLNEQKMRGINPQQVWQLAEQVGYTAHLSWWKGNQDGSFDIIFCRNDLAPKYEVNKVAHPFFAYFWADEMVMIKPWASYTNNPLYGKLVQKLVPQVRELIQQKLPSYMLPQGFVLLNALPLTPNGKVDRKALPTFDTATRNLTTGFLAPRTSIEVQMASVWSQILGIERIGVNDNFFKLGGHSLLATQLVTRIRDQFKVDLPLNKIFEYPTFKDLATYLDTCLWCNESVNSQPLNLDEEEIEL